MDGFIGAIVTALVRWVAGWFAGRNAAKEATAATDRQAAASVDAEQIDRATEVKLDESRAHTADAVDAVRHAPATADGVREQYAEAQTAIDRANTGGDVR